MNVYDANEIMVPEGSVRRILDLNDIVLWEKNYVHSGVPFYIKDLSGEPNTISFSKDDGVQWSIIEKSSNGTSWTTVGETGSRSRPLTLTIRPNEIIYLRSSTVTQEGITQGYHISASKSHSVGGNMMSLVVGSGFNGSRMLSDTKSVSIPWLFYRDTNLIYSHELLLPTKLTNCNIRGMFDGCTSLTTAPALPATTLTEKCYMMMFGGCISLTTAPALPATTLADMCYYSMFVGCSGLTTAPTLPATTLANMCYSDMFNGCTSLTTAPALPATTLAAGCYQQMFDGCTSLTTAPALPATTLAARCYSTMFAECTSLVNAPELPALVLEEECYFQLFYGCTSLNDVRCNAIDISANDCTYLFMYNVASTGTFHKNSGMDNWPRNNDGVPRNWTIVNL